MKQNPVFIGWAIGALSLIWAIAAWVIQWINSLAKRANMREPVDRRTYLAEFEEFRKTYHEDLAKMRIDLVDVKRELKGEREARHAAETVADDMSKQRDIAIEERSQALAERDGFAARLTKAERQIVALKAELARVRRLVSPATRKHGARDTSKSAPAPLSEENAEVVGRG